MSWRDVLISVPLTKCGIRLGHAVAPAASCQLLIVGSLVRTQGSSCGIFDRESGTGMVSSQCFGFPLLVSLHHCFIFTHVSYEG